MMESTVLEDLRTELEIPADGTLSRVVYKDDSIRVVGFAFDEGQELTEHTAAVPAIVQVIQGRLRVTLGERTVDASPGTWIHMPARLAHGVLALEPTVMLLTMIRD
ncbi:MAG TPA: cupin domain-containing protein [Acidimicrobiia bacterium]|nr:cupin domain-containing protein [Acidimicrobiia bacterium]